MGLPVHIVRCLQPRGRRGHKGRQLQLLDGLLAIYRGVANLRWTKERRTDVQTGFQHLIAIKNTTRTTVDELPSSTARLGATGEEEGTDDNRMSALKERTKATAHVRRLLGAEVTRCYICVYGLFLGS